LLFPWQKFTDPKGAIFAGVWFLLCITLLATSNWLPFPIWAITLFFALVQLAKDVIVDLIHRNDLRYKIDNETVNPTNILSMHLIMAFFQLKLNFCVDEVKEGFNSPPPARKSQQPQQSTESNGNQELVPLDDDAIGSKTSTDTFSSIDLFEEPSEAQEASPTSPYRSIQVIKRLPWAIVPFVVGVFIIVEALSVVGFTRIVASGFAAAITDASSRTCDQPTLLQ